MAAGRFLDALATEQSSRMNDSCNATRMEKVTTEQKRKTQFSCVQYGTIATVRVNLTELQSNSQQLPSA